MPRIPKELRPQVIERIRQLNAQRLFDTEIGAQLGYSPETIRSLRNSADIPAVSGMRNRPGPAAHFTIECPTCGLLIGVERGVLEPHRGFFGRVGPGAVNGMPTRVVDECPSGFQPYTRTAPAADTAAA